MSVGWFMSKLNFPFLGLVVLSLAFTSHPWLVLLSLPFERLVSREIARQEKNRNRRTKERIQEYLYDVLRVSYHKKGLLYPRLENQLALQIGVEPDYSIESSLISSPRRRGNNELIILEKEMNMLSDKLSLRMLVLFGIPLVYFTLSIGLKDSFAMLGFAYLIFAYLFSLFRINYDPRGITEAMNDLAMNLPSTHRDLLHFEKYIDVWTLESSSLPSVKKGLSIPQEIVATVLVATLHLDPVDRNEVLEQFLEDFRPMRQFENSFVANVEAQRIKDIFNLIATSVVLGIFVGIGKLLSGFSIPFFVQIDFPEFLDVTTGILFVSQLDMKKGIVGFGLYYFLFGMFSILFGIV